MESNQKNLYSVITLAQTLIRSEKDNNLNLLITPILISEKVDLALSLVTTIGNTQEIRDAAISELVRRFSEWIGKELTLFDNTGHVEWNFSERKKDWRYWHRYMTLLEKKMSNGAITNLDESTDEILEMLEDPNREGHWDRRGLIVGHVQSGKTGHYSGLICKAADSGYKIIIVLAGLHNNLRAQTQIRLEESFLGYETSTVGEYGSLIGVGFIDSDQRIHPHCATTRSDNGDFNTRVSRHLAISPEEKPWLFVVKKNKKVLERLLKWIKTHVADSKDAETGRKFVSNLPLLMIDDEADHASVDTGEQVFVDGIPDDEHQPKAINSLIRKILYTFAKSAYVGYTATPFANIFIHRKNETKEEGQDLFPKSFIRNIAAPSSYVGPARLFGIMLPSGRVGGLPLIRVINDHTDEKGINGWMPAKHNKDHVPLYDGKRSIPPSLKQAIYAFVLACCARKVRKQNQSHCSMLIHVTRYTLVQEEVHKQVQEFISDITKRILRDIDSQAIISDLKTIWESDFIPTSNQVVAQIPISELPQTAPLWDEIANELSDVLGEIKLQMINGNAKDILDYSDSSKGIKVIAIGGDKLARGLTLEGLCISYFVRTSKMYDTLMQMGRWFGYRPGYIDLCRLYTSKDLVTWFKHITDASEELREEFDNMVESGGTPEKYGLKVQSHSILTVTSPLKMRSAHTLRLSYSGDFVQTVAIYKDIEKLKQNLEATNELLLSIGPPTETAPSREREHGYDTWKKSYLWRGVNSNNVIDFLMSYQSHPKATRANSQVLAEFISKMTETGELVNWTVALLADGQKTNPFTFSNGIEISTMPSRSDTNVEGRYSIGVLTDPSDESIDLDYPRWKAAMDQTLLAWKPDIARNRVTPPERPNGKKIRNIRGFGLNDIPASPDTGLLLLYPLNPIDPTSKKAISDNWDKPIIAFAISFASSNSDIKVEYKVDHLLWEQEYGPSD